VRTPLGSGPVPAAFRGRPGRMEHSGRLQAGLTIAGVAGNAPNDPCLPHTAPQAHLHSAAARAVPHRQDRIDGSGAWWSSSHPASQQQQQQQQPYVIGPSAGRGDTAPNSPPVSDAAVDQLAELVQSARGALVLTGAGCSTESGVPDYRCAA